MKPKTWTLPKFALLQRRLGIGPAFAAGILEGIWHLAATFDPESGGLPYNGEELAAWLGVDLDPERLMTALIDGRWVDANGQGLTVHDWQHHMPKYLRDTLRKREQRANNVSRDCPGTTADCPGTVLGPAPPSDSDSESDQLNQLTRISLTEAEVAEPARCLFRAAGYRGEQGRWFWKAGALMHAGLLAESDVIGLAGVAASKSNPPKYFYQSLKRNLAQRGDDLRALSERVTIVPHWPAVYPGD